jgi:two-component system sensor histidine kinase UhpB
MSVNTGVLDRFQGWISNTSLYTRIAIGNSVIIIIGAVGGTIITHFFTERGIELLSILLLALAGITVSVLLNLWIVRTALHPLFELRQFVDGFDLVETSQPGLALTNPDPETDLLAASLSTLIEQLERSNHQLRLLSKRAINAQEEERKRIARHLHDETAQSLSSLIINLERLEKRFPEDEQGFKTQLNAARQLSSSILAELRNIIHGLRPAILDDLGLIPAIRWYARSNLERAGIKVDIQAPDEPLSLPPDLKTTLFRIAQEGINNIVRHSGASSAKINLGSDKNEIYLWLQDDGSGFQVAQNQREAIRMRHWGLVGIQERVDLVNGRFSVISDPQKGSRIEVYIPLPENEEVFDGQNPNPAR